MSDGVVMTSEEQPKERRRDLEERTALFGEAVIRFAKKVPLTPITRPLIGQLVDAGTSVGANYCEAQDGESIKDFRHKIGICRKESRESKYWFRMIVAACDGLAEEARVLWKEADELNRIFGKSMRTCDKRLAESKCQ
jgi:four helix bundle protein